ncbi:MAG: hypothetical protein IPK29_09665 [Betaproteobacteria bacterium]|nr:hypothetical protein [Betaproteobacteria bacterium]
MARASASKARKTGRQGRAKTTAATGRYLGAAVASSHRYCAARFPKARRFAPGVAAGRARLIRQSADKWMNGSTLRYWFFDKPKKWGAAEAQKDVVRAAFASWKALGIGLDFVEVERRADADLRIAFQIGDGSWSYIGTDVRTPREDPRTMNFGWDLLEDPQEGMDTALHETGHTLGFPHEHQNPFAGIVWNEAAVYAAMKGEPNYWDRATTFQNIIEKIVPDSVQGSDWDPGLGHALSLRPGHDRPARALPRRAGAGRRALGARSTVGAEVLPGDGGAPAARAGAARNGGPGPGPGRAGRFHLRAGSGSRVRVPHLRHGRYGDGPVCARCARRAGRDGARRGRRLGHRAQRVPEAQAARRRALPAARANAVRGRRGQDRGHGVVRRAAISARGSARRGSAVACPRGRGARPSGRPTAGRRRCGPGRTPACR